MGTAPHRHYGSSPHVKNIKIQSAADTASSPISASQIASCQRSAHMGYAAEYLIPSYSVFVYAFLRSCLVRILYHFLPMVNASSSKESFNLHHPIIHFAKRHQRPPSAKQPNHERKQTPPVHGHDVQKYSTVRGHGREVVS